MNSIRSKFKLTFPAIAAWSTQRPRGGKASGDFQKGHHSASTRHTQDSLQSWYGMLYRASARSARVYPSFANRRDTKYPITSSNSASAQVVSVTSVTPSVTLTFLSRRPRSVILLCDFSQRRTVLICCDNLSLVYNITKQGVTHSPLMMCDRPGFRRIFVHHFMHELNLMCSQILCHAVILVFGTNEGSPHTSFNGYASPVCGVQAH